MSEIWPLTKLGECCDILDNLRVPLNAEERGDIQGDVPYYGANGLQGYIDKFIFDEPLILLAEDGGYFDEYESRPIAYRVSGKSWVNNHAHILRAKNGSSFCQDFIFYCLQHKNITPFIKGGTRAKLNQAELREILIPRAPEPIQCRIAEILLTLDQAIEQTEALVAKHQQIKAGLMYDLFTRGVTPDGHLRPTREQAPDLYKESPLGWIPKEWEVAEIQTVSSLCVDCPHTTPILSDEGYPMARTSEIRDGGLHIDLSPRVSREQYLSRVSRGVPQEGDIVFAREAPVGEAFVIPPDVELCLGQRVMLIRLNRTRCQPEFFLFQLYSARVQREFDRIVGGTTNPHLNVGDIRKFKICIPNLCEQERTASRLLSVSDRMISESKQLAKLRKQKHGLMHDLLTGRVRVKPTETEPVRA